jgi:hypothetical protein
MVAGRNGPKRPQLAALGRLLRQGLEPPPRVQAQAQVQVQVQVLGQRPRGLRQVPQERLPSGQVPVPVPALGRREAGPPQQALVPGQPVRPQVPVCA